MIRRIAEIATGTEIGQQEEQQQQEEPPPRSGMAGRGFARGVCGGCLPGHGD